MKTAVVTGATSGIGLSTVKRLVGRDVCVIGIGRDENRCKAAKEEVLRYAPLAEVEYILSDLSTTRGVRDAAAQVKVLTGRVDLLIHCAGTVSSWFVSTSEGFELQFAVNHLAPFLLTLELMDCLEKSDDARVLVVSSASHYHTRVRWEDIMMRRHYSCLAAYKQSKLLNVLFIKELARRYPSVTGFAVDPGLVNTSIGLKGTRGIERAVWKWRMSRGVAPDVPAGHLAVLACDPAFSGKSGGYWKDGRELAPSPAARDEREAERLWALSEKLCGL